MKEIIKSVLDKHKDSQINLGSEAAREHLASEIEEVLIKKWRENEKNSDSRSWLCWKGYGKVF